ncbi:MAG: hypothetical protein HY929_08690 [Euryarchaeota archaeon]|nr:hypothetical protein [Euryarchaeota archaeon]
MPRKYPEMIKKEVRERIINRESKLSVSQDMDVPYGTILTWTGDIKRRKSYSQEIKQEVRERVSKEGSKISVAEDIGICYSTILNWTRDITVGQGNKGIRGRSLKIIQDLMEKGYSMKTVSRYTKTMLKKYFPVKITRIKRRSILYLEEREEEAFKALVKDLKGKVISYQELGMMAKAFGLENAGKVRDVNKKERFLIRPKLRMYKPRS